MKMGKNMLVIEDIEDHILYVLTSLTGKRMHSSYVGTHLEGKFYFIQKFCSSVFKIFSSYNNILYIVTKLNINFPKLLKLVEVSYRYVNIETSVMLNPSCYHEPWTHIYVLYFFQLQAP